MPVTSPPAHRTPSRGFCHWLLIFFAAAMVVAAVEIAGVFFLSREADKLKVAILDHTESPLETKVQFSVGSGLLGLSRLVLQWVPDVPPQARQALAALDEASVGVYEFNHTPSSNERMRMIRLADERLQKQGWKRTVAVSQRNETVLVYVPDGPSGEAELQVCVAVCEGRNLVVVSALTSVEALVALASNHGAELRKLLQTPERKRA